MKNGIEKIEEVIDFIEENITSDIDCNVLAKKMNLSVYEFRRIFAFIVGCPISEYIRKRRLSLAACEILTSDKCDMLELSEKYGYSSQSAFIKAFGEQHGVSPTNYLKQKCEINLFTRPKFSLNVSGNENVPFKIIKDDKFHIKGYNGISNITDSCCCENVWNEFYQKQVDKKLCENGKYPQIYASYTNKESNVSCTIGARTNSIVSDFDFETIPDCRFACFEMETVDDDIVNRNYSKILYEILPSANLEREWAVPTVEVYPFDMSQDGFKWEIRIPIKTRGCNYV